MSDLPEKHELTRKELAEGFRRVGLSAGDGVIVHSSFKSFGGVEGGPATVIEALKDVLTPDGTLMMPAFNQLRAFQEGGEGIFDPRTTPAVTGVITDTFWRMEGVLRSLDPSHSFAAWGKNAKRYLENHHRTLSVGPDSPLELLGREDGKGLLLGVGYRANTYHHVVEIIVGCKCVGERTQAVPVRLPDGRTVMGRTWTWRSRNCPIDDGATRYGPQMKPFQTETMIGQSQAISFFLSDCFDVVAKNLRNGLGEFPPCSRCPILPLITNFTVPSDWDDEKKCLKPDSVAWTY